jgi:histidine kinase
MNRLWPCSHVCKAQLHGTLRLGQHGGRWTACANEWRAVAQFGRASTLIVPAMAKKADKQQASALDEVRRHVRIFVDLGRVASESTDEDGFLDQVVVQVARAVEIDHVKVLRYRRREADVLIAAGFGWKEGVVRSDDGIVSLVNVPVLIESAAWGVLEVDSTRPRDSVRTPSSFSPLRRTDRRISPEPSSRIKRGGKAGSRRYAGVRNSFQIILASIAIQKRRYAAGDAQCALDHIASHINAISLAHDQLAAREKGQIVKLSDYLRALCLSLKQQTEGIEVQGAGRRAGWGPGSFILGPCCSLRAAATVGTRRWAIRWSRP